MRTCAAASGSSRRPGSAAGRPPPARCSPSRSSGEDAVRDVRPVHRRAVPRPEDEAVLGGSSAPSATVTSKGSSPSATATRRRWILSEATPVRATNPRTSRAGDAAPRPNGFRRATSAREARAADRRDQPGARPGAARPRSIWPTLACTPRVGWFVRATTSKSPLFAIATVEVRCLKPRNRVKLSHPVWACLITPGLGPMKGGLL